MYMMFLRTVTALAATALLLPPTLPAGAQERPDPPRVQVVELPRAAPLARAWIGLQIEEVDDLPELLILEVEADSPGDQAGLQEGEVIVEVDGEGATLERLRSQMTALDPGDTIRLRIRSKDGASREVAVETGERMPQVRVFGADGEESFIELDPGATFADVQARFFGSDSTSVLPPMFTRRLPAGVTNVRILPSVVSGREGSGVMGFVGQDAVAGARFTPINEGLASYFGVERGLLVVEVVEGTPAADAGLESGDVVVRANGAEVRAVEELRRRVMEGYRSPPVGLRVIRDGREVELELDRG